MTEHAQIPVTKTARHQLIVDLITHVGVRSQGELAELLGDVIGEEGWRDRMLRLHGMAHTVINDAGFAGAADETLPELASEITGQMREAIARLETWIQRIEPLEELAARD